jgi:hypothetical protein
MFSVRRTTNHPEYAHKNKRLTLCRRAKQITLRRDEILLLRLIIDSRILIDQGDVVDTYVSTRPFRNE